LLSLLFTIGRLDIHY